MLAIASVQVSGGVLAFDVYDASSVTIHFVQSTFTGNYAISPAQLVRARSSGPVSERSCVGLMQLDVIIHGMHSPRRPVASMGSAIPP